MKVSPAIIKQQFELQQQQQQQQHWLYFYRPHFTFSSPTSRINLHLNLLGEGGTTRDEAAEEGDCSKISPGLSLSLEKYLLSLNQQPKIHLLGPCWFFCSVFVCLCVVFCF